MSDMEWQEMRNTLRNNYIYKKQDINNNDYIKGGLSEYVVVLLTVDKENSHVILHIINEFRITYYLDFPMEEFEKKFNKVEISNT